MHVLLWTMGAIIIKKRSSPQDPQKFQRPLCKLDLLHFERCHLNDKIVTPYSEMYP